MADEEELDVNGRERYLNSFFAEFQKHLDKEVQQSEGQEYLALRRKDWPVVVGLCSALLIAIGAWVQIQVKFSTIGGQVEMTQRRVEEALDKSKSDHAESLRRIGHLESRNQVMIEKIEVSLSQISNTVHALKTFVSVQETRNKKIDEVDRVLREVDKKLIELASSVKEIERRTGK